MDWIEVKKKLPEPYEDVRVADVNDKEFSPFGLEPDLRANFPISYMYPNKTWAFDRTPTHWKK